MTETVKHEPGPKPTYQVVESALKCQTHDGEVSISLLVPYDRLMDMMRIDQVPDEEAPDFLLTRILSEEDARTIRNLSDGAEAIGILMEFSKALGQKLGVSLGKLQGSSNSSGSTDQPSPTTSDTDSTSQ